MKLLFRTLPALLVATLVALPAFAQEQRGSIEGIVKDSSGAVLPGVTVEARNPAGGAVATSITDATGAYRFPALPPESMRSRPTCRASRRTTCACRSDWASSRRSTSR